jgi:LacI family transcriptional regulator/LacI family repressor for deo operon, udp, cdd, tsx, nupC, and nupG
MATIKEVAALADVSTATVSYVLNGTGKVSAATRRRVREAIERLNYEPSHAARSLRGHGRTLGLVLSRLGRLADPALAELLAGAADAAAKQGYYLLIGTSSGEADGTQELQLARAGRVDGLILLDLRADDERVAQLAARRVPYVCVGRAPADRTSIAVEAASQAGAAQALGYLLSLGHRRVALIQLPSELTDSEPRYLGYAAALAAAGLDVDPTLIVEGGRGQEDGYQAMQELMSLEEPPTAVLACSDELAFGAMHLLHDEGLEVGRDVSVVGFDDVPLAAHTHPPLTTLRQPRRALGAQAAEILIGMVEQQPPSRGVVLDMPLIVRKSCGPPRSLEALKR